MRGGQTLQSWWRTRRAMAMDTAALARHRAAQWEALQPALRNTPALARWAGVPLTQFPVAEPAEVRADYGRWNSIGIGDTALRAMADAAERGRAGDGLAVGWSTGTSGAGRGLFMADAAERADYLGQSLARMLPLRALFARQRLALHLRADSALYSDVRRRRFTFAHFPLDRPIGQAVADMAVFDPTIIIATPLRLLELADHLPASPGLRHLFYGADGMSLAERAHVAARLGLMPLPIYQATEGFIAAPCRHGRLHLNEHALEVELEPVSGTAACRPIITDLRRRSQPVVRLRMDDLVERDDSGPCPCGYAGRLILPPEGRHADIWRLGGRCITPAQVAAAMDDKLRGATRWQAIANPQGVVLRLDAACSPALAHAAAGHLRDRLDLPVDVRAVVDLGPWPGPKRRRVVWDNG